MQIKSQLFSITRRENVIEAEVSSLAKGRMGIGYISKYQKLVLSTFAGGE